MLDTPDGAVTLNAPRQPGAVPGGPVGPPPGLEPATPVPVAGRPVSRDGSYTGTADVLVTGGGLCIENRKVADFYVRGNSVRFGQFRGTIAPDNGLQMVLGQEWITGQFEGATFHGQFDIPGRFGNPGCTYMLNLQRTGP